MRSAEVIAAWALAKARRRSGRLLALAGRHGPDPSDPVIGPDAYRRDFARWNDLGLDLEAARDLARREANGEPTGHPDLAFGFSTGTLGAPGVFLASARDRARWLGTFLAHVLTVTEALRFLAGGSAAILLRHDSRIYHQTGGRTRFLPLGQGADSLAAALAEKPPKILIGPPSALRRIVESEAFSAAPFRVRLVVAGGEPLWPEDEAVIAARLGAEIRQVYQAAEGFFGASCRCGRIHLAADALRFEAQAIAGAPSRFVPVVTDPARHGPQRLRRYRTDDVAVAAEGPCPCGSALPSIAGIEGRLADVIVGPGERLHFPRDLHAAIAPHLGGLPFRLIQEAGGRLRLEVDGRVERTAAGRAAEAVAAVTGLAVDVASLPPLPLEAKFRRFERRLPLPDDFFAQRLGPPVSLSTVATKVSRGR